MNRARGVRTLAALLLCLAPSAPPTIRPTSVWRDVDVWTDEVKTASINRAIRWW
jgi:hypothetical protein